MLPPGVRHLPEEQTREMEKYPLLPLILRFGNKQTPIMEGLVDSGATDLLLPKFVAEELDLPHLEEDTMNGIGGEYPAYKTKVNLQIGRGGRTFNFGEIDACISGVDMDSPILVGHKPLFETFKITFDTKKEKLYLIEHK